MAVYLHGFDWTLYAERIMPAFARWIIEGEESGVYALFERTRCVEEERYLPEPMLSLRVWPRASAFVKNLPRGQYSRHEYQELCSAERFTALSDCYLHDHAPHLYQDSDTLRAVWGAIIEQHCLLWNEHGLPPVNTQPLESSGAFSASTEYTRPVANPALSQVAQEVAQLHSELITLLQSAGLSELADELDQLSLLELGKGKSGYAVPSRTGKKDATRDEISEDEDEQEQEWSRPEGILLGHHPNMLHMRGWLAGISVRAMVLFEFLACGRRAMPFGYEPAEPFGCFIGYLTPDEVWQLASCLRSVSPPTPEEVEQDAQFYKSQQTLSLVQSSLPVRFVDEILPAYAPEFLQVVRTAALQGIGLICATVSE